MISTFENLNQSYLGHWPDHLGHALLKVMDILAIAQARVADNDDRIGQLGEVFSQGKEERSRRVSIQEGRRPAQRAGPSQSAARMPVLLRSSRGRSVAKGRRDFKLQRSD